MGALLGGTIQPLTHYISNRAYLFFIILSINLLAALTVINIILWTVPPKSRKQALKNINGDKKLYRKIWRKSGYFVAFAVVSSVSISQIFLNFILSFILIPYVFETSFNLGVDTNTLIFLLSYIYTYILFLVGYIISISFKSKADKAALNKSSHTGIVKKIKENKYKKK